MASVLVYGRSDDLCEVDGDIRDEFGAWGHWAYLHFSEGTVVKMGYDLVDDKGWHIEIVKPGTAKAEVLEPEIDDYYHYTDRLRLTGDITSVKCWATEDGPDAEDVAKWLENVEVDSHPIEKWREVMAMLNA